MTPIPPGRILIVDDERDNRELVAIILGHEGHVILTAADGAHALALIAERTPDLVLLDVMMPDMDGYQVAARIKGDVASREVPIILVTAMDDAESRQRGLDAGVEHFLCKPFQRAELRSRVSALLRLEVHRRS
mgnify:CR=1 FL=1